MRARVMVLLCAFAVAPDAGAQPVVIQRVTVIDATGKAAQPDMTVVMADGRIAAVTPSKAARIPSGAQVVDGAGKFLIPGLWDMHVHGAADQRAPWSYPLYLANGVLGVREMFGPSDVRGWRARQSSLEAPAPRIYLGSHIVDGPNPRWPGSIVAANATQGRDVVAELQQLGVDFIKVYTRLPADAYFAIADEARKRGITFAGHVPESVTAAEASAAGQKSIEHLTGVVEGCSRNEAALLPELRSARMVLESATAALPDKMTAGQREMMLVERLRSTYDEAVAQSLFAGFVKNGTWQCPTLTVIRAQMDRPERLSDPRLKYVTRNVRAVWEAGVYNGLPPPVQTALRESAKAGFEASVRIVGGMYRAGVKLLAGTDAMNPECFPGFGLHEELALLVDAGLPPLAALQTATRNAAEFMGQLDRTGTVEVGKSADLVLLDKNPLDDIRNTRAIQAIVLKGKVIPRSGLDAMLTEAETLAAR